MSTFDRRSDSRNSQTSIFATDIIKSLIFISPLFIIIHHYPRQHVLRSVVVLGRFVWWRVRFVRSLVRIRSPAGLQWQAGGNAVGAALRAPGGGK